MSPARWTRLRVVTAAKVWAHETGRAPTATDWQRATDSHPSHMQVVRIFGGQGDEPWARLRSEAGLEHMAGGELAELAGELLSTRGRHTPEGEELQRHISFLAANGIGAADRQRLLALSRCAIRQAGSLAA